MINGLCPLPTDEGFGCSIALLAVFMSTVPEGSEKGSKSLLELGPVQCEVTGAGG